LKAAATQFISAQKATAISFIMTGHRSFLD